MYQFPERRWVQTLLLILGALGLVTLPDIEWNSSHPSETEIAKLREEVAALRQYVEQANLRDRASDDTVLKEVLLELAKQQRVSVAPLRSREASDDAFGLRELPGDAAVRMEAGDSEVPFGPRRATVTPLSHATRRTPVFEAESANLNVFFGNLHSHSAVSDGIGTPTAAYEYARNEAGVDFLCLSEHNHMVDAGKLAEVQAASIDTTTASFVAIAGQEYSVLKKGNHINVYDVVEPVPESLNSNYFDFYRTWLPQQEAANPDAIIVCQFNHPKSFSKDYGIAPAGDHQNYSSDWDAFVADVDPWVSLIAIISGPSDSNKPKVGFTPTVGEHRDVKSQARRNWLKYLDAGFHLSPVADQDNHRGAWGDRTTARTGVWVAGTFTRETLLQALTMGRCYATEDQDLEVWFEVGGNPMGERLPLPEEEEVSGVVRVTDADEPDSEYVIEVLYDVVGDGDTAIVVEESPVITSGSEWTFSVSPDVDEASFVVVHVNQEGSSDDAWTAPIWFEQH